MVESNASHKSRAWLFWAACDMWSYEYITKLEIKLKIFRKGALIYDNWKSSSRQNFKRDRRLVFHNTFS